MIPTLAICAALGAGYYVLFAAAFNAAIAGDTEMKPRIWNFDSDKVGAVAEGFTNEVGDWKVLADDSAIGMGQLFAQLAQSPKPIYNVTLVSGTNVKNLDLTVRMKPVAGEIDQGGGVVWRARDAKNYYICRYNPLEDNFRVYKVEDGKRTEFASADIARTPGWHTFRVTMKGEHIECYLDGKKHLEVNDGTFKESGKIGLWTKADAQTHFDDLTLKPEPQ
jgi:hypothetical protein